jgi:uracil-DNA glycosylase
MGKISNDWINYIGDEFEKDYYKNLRQFLVSEYNEHLIFPRALDIFNAFHYTPYKDVKVVILGQDPYHNIGQAHGLSFSVLEGIKKPPSLENIFKELNDDLNIPIPQSGNLVKWTQEGVMLLNTVLTVRAHEAHSHRNRGWEIFTDAVIRVLNEREDPVIFLLWGRPAQEKEKLISNPKHHILKAPHPSPLSAHRGFFGCKHFSKTNEILRLMGKREINWEI